MAKRKCKGQKRIYKEFKRLRSDKLMKIDTQIDAMHNQIKYIT